MSFVAICTRKRMPVYRYKVQCTSTLHGGKYILPRINVLRKNDRKKKREGILNGKQGNHCRNFHGNDKFGD